MTGRLRRARAANTAVFFATGAVYGAWATRIPAIQDRLDLTAGALGLAILGLEGGAVAGLPAGGALVARVGSPWALRVGFGLFPVALVGVALAPALPALALALAVMAAATSVVDVAMNVQGIELERRYRRPVLSGMHAGHPLGLLAGGLAGAAAAAAHVPVAAHFTAAAGLGMLVGGAATCWLVREEMQECRPLARPSGRLALLGLIAFCAFLLDAAAANWSAVHLRQAHHSGPGLAAAAFTAFALALALGRLGGDRMVARVGRVRVVQAGGVLAALGSLLVVLAPSVAVVFAGWAVFGLGVAAIAPTVLGAAPQASELPAPVAIAAVTTIGYLGSFSGPPLIGAMAEVAGLTAALGLLVAVAALMPVLAARWSREPTVTK
jgi:MFS family permease